LTQKQNNICSFESGLHPLIIPAKASHTIPLDMFAFHRIHHEFNQTPLPQKISAEKIPHRPEQKRGSRIVKTAAEKRLSINIQSRGREKFADIFPLSHSAAFGGSIR